MMLDLEGNMISNKEELVDYLEAKRALNYKTPAFDTGYCLCGTVWTIEAFPPGCPDCGEEAAAIERASPQSIEKRSDTDPSTRPDGGMTHNG